MHGRSPQNGPALTWLGVCSSQIWCGGRMSWISLGAGMLFVSSVSAGVSV
jgi:hypothetical protein